MCRKPQANGRQSLSLRKFPLRWGIEWAVLLLLLSPLGSSRAASPAIPVYAGGVAGIAALASPKTSAKFRAGGGNLYLHNSGWATLNRAQQQRVLTTFKNQRIALEIGFKEGGEKWAHRLQTGYLALGIAPTFIASNAFDKGNAPTADGWILFSNTLRKTGLPDTTKIFPTFEYANFQQKPETLRGNTVRKRRDFQSIILFAGGIVLDAPPGYAFQRGAPYQEWMVDAIRWTRQQGLRAVWITSPHIFYDTFEYDTAKFLRFLKDNDALPTDIICENYNAHPPKNYPNIVGHENIPHTVLGNAWYLSHTFLPGIAASRTVQ